MQISELKKSHEEMFHIALEFERAMSSKELDYSDIIVAYQNLLITLAKNEIVSLPSDVSETANNETLESDEEEHLDYSNVFADQRYMLGHIQVINEFLAGHDLRNIKIALENDGRMLLSKVKERIFMEERIVDRLLFLRMVN